MLPLIIPRLDNIIYYLNNIFSKEFDYNLIFRAFWHFGIDCKTKKRKNYFLIYYDKYITI